MALLARGSTPWVLASIAIALIATWFSLFLVEIIAFLAFFSLLIFFRDPERYPEGEGLLSPADGVILDVASDRIIIFLNLHNVHVNRSPLAGIVKDINYIKGRFLPAFKKESENNERNIIKLETSEGEIEVVQIAGVLARRIHCYVKTGDKLQRGERIGMISFGSRVDVTIPKNYSIIVKPGVKVKAGQTVLARKEL
ncbi:MAG: phosphatidylserine decarboxylase [Halobacteria archaeon]